MKMFPLVFFLVLGENTSVFATLKLFIIPSSPSQCLQKEMANVLYVSILEYWKGGVQEHKEFLYPFYTSEVCLVTS